MSGYADPETELAKEFLERREEIGRSDPLYICPQVGDEIYEGQI